MTFEVKVRGTGVAFIGTVPEKSLRIIKSPLKGLEKIRFPGAEGIRKNWFFPAAGRYTGFISPAHSPHFTVLTKGTGS